MRCHSRRQLLRGSIALAGFSLVRAVKALGQPAPKVPRIGFLAVGSRNGRAFLIEGFRQGLREHGYVEGQNIVIEYRFSEDRNDRLPALPAELVALKVQIILASGTPASFAARHYQHDPDRHGGPLRRSGRDRARCEPRAPGWQHHRDEYDDRAARREAARAAQADGAW